MDYFFLLMLIYISFVFISYVISEGRLVAPSFIFSASFCCMICIAYIFESKLGFEVGFDTFTIFTTAGVLFLLAQLVTSYLAKHIVSSRQILSHTKRALQKPACLSIQRWVLNSTIVLLFIAIMMSVLCIVINTNGGNLNSIMAQYKNGLLYHADSMKLRFLISQIYKFCYVIAYICLYIVVYNYSKSGIPISKQKRYVFIVALFAVFSMLFTAARQNAVELVVFAFLVYFSLMVRKIERSKIRKTIVKLIPLAVAMVFLFYVTSFAVGRNTKRSPIEYFAVYLCGGLYSFNLHVGEPARNLYWGQASFSEIYSMLNRIGVVTDDAVSSYHSFDLYGNTVTMFGRWYEDFGRAGVYIMTILVSVAFSYFFYKKLYTSVDKGVGSHFARILYCRFIIALVWAGYDDRIRPLFSVSNIVIVILTAIVYHYTVNKKLVFTISRGNT